MPPPVRLAFLGCGFITQVHSRHLKALGAEVVPSYASRDRARAEEYCRRFNGARGFGDYASAIASPDVDAVVIAVPPKFHLDLTLQALAAGKHVLVEKPAFPSMDGYLSAKTARDRTGRVVLVGENDHYKPLAVTLRRLLAEGAIGEMVFAHFTTIAKRLKSGDDWRNDESMAGGDAFFEEGIHWLHIANSLGPKIVSAHGYRPSPARAADVRSAQRAGGTSDPKSSPDVPPSPHVPHAEDRRQKSMLVAFHYDTGAVGALYYSREVPSLFRGLRASKLFGRDGIITFESNGALVVVRGRGLPRVIQPGLRDIRGYQAMYRDFVRAIRTGQPPEMSLERAIEDQRVMDQIYATLGAAPGAPADV
jgi:predicted dehydrogenase